jgi:hypothetical protein
MIKSLFQPPVQHDCTGIVLMLAESSPATMSTNDVSVFHERSPLLANSAWQKLSQWPGMMGHLAKIGRFATAGVARIPALAAIAVVDGTVGRLLPQRYARGLTTVAKKS